MRLLSTMALFIAAGNLVFARQATAEPKSSQTIEVAIVNTARVPFHVLAQAHVQAAEIYESANIAPTWGEFVGPLLKQSGASVRRLIVRMHDVRSTARLIRKNAAFR